MIILSALAGAAWVAHRPVPLKSSEAAKPNAKPRDLVDELKQAAIKGSGTVEIGEGELNRHLGRVLTGKMAPSLGQSVKFDRLNIDFEPEVAHLTLVWKVLGHPSTATVDLKVARLEKVFRVEVVGGAYGHLTVPRGFLRPLSPALRGLSDALHDEIQALFQMNEVTFTQNKVVLDPRFP
ncbi:MAG: hypothetical protein V4662_24265 [Verrucomicrobiota bacterium]